MGVSECCFFFCIDVYWKNQNALMSSQSQTGIFHICWYGNVYIQCHMLYIMFHLLTCYFWQPGCRCEKCHYSHVFLFFFCVLSSILGRILYMLTLCHFDLLILPVWTVHPVNLILFVGVFLCQWIPLMTLEAVAKCVSFNPTGTHRCLVKRLLCICIYCM